MWVVALGTLPVTDADALAQAESTSPSWSCRCLEGTACRFRSRGARWDTILWGGRKSWSRNYRQGGVECTTSAKTQEEAENITRVRPWIAGRLPPRRLLRCTSPLFP